MEMTLSSKGAGILIPAFPGMKPPVRDFSPADDGDPREVDTFNRMIRALRNQNLGPVSYVRSAHSA